MHRRQFEWDPEKDQNNQKKHGISLETATAIFDDPMLYEYADSEHSGYNKYGVWENRYIAIGWVSNVLFVVYTVRMNGSDEVYRMISARRATLVERRMYEEWCEEF